MGSLERPKSLCFGNYTIGSEQCTDCLERAECTDDFAGWGMSTFLEDYQRSQITEELVGTIPDWVFIWDSLSETELNVRKMEDPDRYKFYQKLNNSIGE